MIEAPPVDPPIEFPVMSARRIGSHIWSLLFAGTIVTCGGLSIPRGLAKDRSIVLDVFLILFGVFTFVVTGYLWVRDQGAVIRIQGNSISILSPTGAVRSRGLLTNVVQLRALQPISQNKPTSYVLVFADMRRIAFDRNLPNIEALLSLIQQRTGQQFVVHRS